MVRKLRTSDVFDFDILKSIPDTWYVNQAELRFKNKENPNRFNPLTGYVGCFRIRFSGLRLVYAIKGETIWLIIVDKRKRVYKEMAKRIKGL